MVDGYMRYMIEIYAMYVYKRRDVIHIIHHSHTTQTVHVDRDISAMDLSQIY